MATTPDTYLGRRFAEYAGSWPPADRAAALACRDVDERLTYGLHLYHIAQDAAEAVARRMEQTGTAYDREGATYIEALLTLWVAPAAAALVAVAAVEAKGCRVDQSAAFGDAVMDVRVSLSIPVERAAADVENWPRRDPTQTKTQEEMRRELRRRMGA